MRVILAPRRYESARCDVLEGALAASESRAPFISTYFRRQYGRFSLASRMSRPWL